MEHTGLPHDHGEEQNHTAAMQELLRDGAHFQNIADIFRQLGDPNRIRIFWLLCHCEECVVNIAAMMDMSSPAVSHHLRVLKDSGLLPYLRRVFVSEELGADKPSPAFFEPVLHEVGVERSRLLICGDSPSSDIRGGRLCGIDTCLFDPSERYPDTDSTYTIRTLAALLPIVTG